MGKNSINFESENILNEELVARFIASHSKQSTWNETQLQLIVESITNAINSIVEVYYHFPGSAIYFLNLLQENNKHEGKNASIKDRLADYSFKMGYVDGVPELFHASETSFILHQIGINRLSSLKLEQLQKKLIISDLQFSEAHQILDYFLQEAINLLKKAPHYKKAKQDNHLYYPEPPIVIDGKRINPPFPKGQNTQKNKKRKRTSSQQANQAFFNSPKKVKRCKPKKNPLSTNRNNSARTKV